MYCIRMIHDSHQSFFYLTPHFNNQDRLSRMKCYHVSLLLLLAVASTSEAFTVPRVVSSATRLFASTGNHDDQQSPQQQPDDPQEDEKDNLEEEIQVSEMNFFVNNTQANLNATEEAEEDTGPEASPAEADPQEELKASTPSRPHAKNTENYEQEEKGKLGHYKRVHEKVFGKEKRSTTRLHHSPGEATARKRKAADISSRIVDPEKRSSTDQPYHSLESVKWKRIPRPEKRPVDQPYHSLEAVKWKQTTSPRVSESNTDQVGRYKRLDLRSVDREKRSKDQPYHSLESIKYKRTLPSPVSDSNKGKVGNYQRLDARVVGKKRRSTDQPYHSLEAIKYKRTSSSQASANRKVGNYQRLDTRVVGREKRSTKHLYHAQDKVESKPDAPQIDDQHQGFLIERPSRLRRVNPPQRAASTQSGSVGQVGNYGKKRVVGSIVGRPKKKRSSIPLTRLEQEPLKEKTTQEAASAKTTAPQDDEQIADEEVAAIDLGPGAEQEDEEPPKPVSSSNEKPEATSRFRQREVEVGNYGSKRVVGSFSGRPKRSSVQRYNSLQNALQRLEEDEGFRVEKPYRLKRIYVPERKEQSPRISSRAESGSVGQVGNYGKKRLVGSIVGRPKTKRSSIPFTRVDQEPSVAKDSPSNVKAEPLAPKEEEDPGENESIPDEEVLASEFVPGDPDETDGQVEEPSPTTAKTEASPRYGRRDEEVGNYGNKRLVGSLVGRPKRSSFQRYSPPQQSEGVEKKPYRFQLRRIPQSVVGTPKPKRVSGHREKEVPVKKALPTKARPESASRFGRREVEVGNYGSKRVVGSLAGRPKRSSFQRYSSPQKQDEAEGFRVEKPYKLKRIYVPEQKEQAPRVSSRAESGSVGQVGNYGKKRLVGSVVGRPKSKRSSTPFTRVDQKPSVAKDSQSDMKAEPSALQDENEDAEGNLQPEAVQSEDDPNNQAFFLTKIHSEATSRFRSREEKVGNYGNKRLVGSLAGRPKRSSYQRYRAQQQEEKGSRLEEQSFTLRRTKKRENLSPPRESRSVGQVGNYGNKRLVGSVIGTPKVRISVPVHLQKAPLVAPSDVEATPETLQEQDDDLDLAEEGFATEIEPESRNDSEEAELSSMTVQAEASEEDVPAGGVLANDLEQTESGLSTKAATKSAVAQEGEVEVPAAEAFQPEALQERNEDATEPDTPAMVETDEIFGAAVDNVEETEPEAVQKKDEDKAEPAAPTKVEADEAFDAFAFNAKFRAYFAMFDGTKKEMGDTEKQQVDDLFHDDLQIKVGDKTMDKTTHVNNIKSFLADGLKSTVQMFKFINDSYVEYKVHLKSSKIDHVGHSIGEIRDGKFYGINPFDSKVYEQIFGSTDESKTGGADNKERGSGFGNKKGGSSKRKSKRNRQRRR